MTLLLAGLLFIAIAAVAIVVLKRRKHGYQTGGAVTSGRNPSDWTIGPKAMGQNRSAGMPLHPLPCPDGLFCFDFPTKETGHVHYLTFRHGPLTGKSRIVMRYRVEGELGVQIVPKSDPAAPSMITLYFQRFGDDWSGNGKFETYRFYASFATRMPIEVGEYIIEAILDANWTAVRTSSRESAPDAFQEAINNADQVGFVLGGGSGLGHGVFSTGKARMIVEEFSVL